jgi:hypothetical protein
MSDTVRFLAGTLLLTTLCGPAVAQTISQSYAAQRQAANRQRCVNGVVIGGVAGGVLAAYSAASGVLPSERRPAA